MFSHLFRHQTFCSIQLKFRFPPVKESIWNYRGYSVGYKNNMAEIGVVKICGFLLLDGDRGLWQVQPVSETLTSGQLWGITGLAVIFAIQKRGKIFYVTAPVFCIAKEYFSILNVCLERGRKSSLARHCTNATYETKNVLKQLFLYLNFFCSKLYPPMKNYHILVQLVETIKRRGGVNPTRMF